MAFFLVLLAWVVKISDQNLSFSSQFVCLRTALELDQTDLNICHFFCFGDLDAEGWRYNRSELCSCR